MRNILLLCLAVFSLNAKESKDVSFFPGKDLKDINYVTVGLSPILPAYKVTKDFTWIFLPEISVGHRHFINKRFALDYEAVLQMNFNIQVAQVNSSYLFFPMPEYGFYLGAGYGFNECYYFCFEKHKFHYWSSYYALVGMHFKIYEDVLSFVQAKYSQDGCMSIVYGFSF